MGKRNRPQADKNPSSQQQHQPAHIAENDALSSNRKEKHRIKDEDAKETKHTTTPSCCSTVIDFPSDECGPDELNNEDNIEIEINNHTNHDHETISREPEPEITRPNTDHSRVEQDANQAKSPRKSLPFIVNIQSEPPTSITSDMINANIDIDIIPEKQFSVSIANLGRNAYTIDQVSNYVNRNLYQEHQKHKCRRRRHRTKARHSLHAKHIQD